jgi:predicted enzyme related to lactoylglutathione lyase
MLRIGSIVWGVKDVRRAMDFWCAALDYKPLREPETDWVIIVPANGKGQQMSISEVSSDAANRPRHHLDLYAEDQSAEIERLLSIGAQRVDREYPPGADYVVLADPDGNTFCVVEKQTQDIELN